MRVAIVADDHKKELIVEFCIAYCGILAKYKVCATSKTARFVTEATGLSIEELLAGDLGGMEQLISMVTYNEVDLLIFLRNTDYKSYATPEFNELLRMCDMYNIPVATNLAVAEVLVRALDNGDLDWREIMNERAGKSAKNRPL